MRDEDLITFLTVPPTATPDGFDEVILRVSNYQKGTWQAVLKRRDKTLPWAVGIGSTPADALWEALHPTPKPTPRVRKRTRA